MVRLGTEEKIRYDRQLRMPEIGPAGQRKLKAAKVFLAGLGGLGSTTACLLTAAGIGCLRIVDGDTVSLENLNRQILYGTGDVGKPKPDTAADRLRQLNPHCRLEPLQANITAQNAFELVSDCRIVVDATDNLATRLALNRVSVARKIPFVFGGIQGLHGMATTFVPPQTPCLACLFPGTGQNEPVKTPVVSPLPALVASIQALETIKWIVGAGKLLTNRLLRIDGVNCCFKITTLEKNPSCPVCSP
jgi:adenylyltransferase/sulfurtransferase